MSLNSSIKAPIGLAAILTLLASPAHAHLPIPPKKSEHRKLVQIPVSEFALVDQNGKRFQFANTSAKWILVTFIFTACPDVCPMLTAKIASLQRTLSENNQSDYLILSISTDPERDTPAVLRAYGEQYQADFRYWLFLTGSRAELAEVWKNFGINVNGTAASQVRHTALTTLIDQRRIRRVDYYTDKWHEKELLKDIDWLATGSRR